MSFSDVASILFLLFSAEKQQHFPETRTNVHSGSVLKAQFSSTRNSIVHFEMKIGNALTTRDRMMIAGSLVKSPRCPLPPSPHFENSIPPQRMILCLKILLIPAIQKDEELSLTLTLLLRIIFTHAHTHQRRKKRDNKRVDSRPAS